MAGALLNRIAYHCVLPTPDHVAHTPVGFQRDAFRATALLTAVLEALGCAAGVLLWRPTDP